MAGTTNMIEQRCVKMTSIDPMHEETSKLKVKKHNELLTKQYLVACYLPTHPNHRTVTNDHPPRHKPDVTHLVPTIANTHSVKEAQSSLH